MRDAQVTIGELAAEVRRKIADLTALRRELGSIISQCGHGTGRRLPYHRGPAAGFQHKKLRKQAIDTA
jgi:hypothetical protein